MSNSQIPGADLSYAELLEATSSDDVRVAWSQLSKVADAFGMTTVRANGMVPRSASVGELVESISQVLPHGVAIEDVMVATQAMLGRERTEVFEVRRLRHAAESTTDVWVLVDTYTDEQKAVKRREEWAEKTGDITVVVMIHTIIERDTVSRPSWA